MRAPFGWLAAGYQKPVFVVLVGLTLAAMGGLQVLGRPLKTGAADQGIVSFELAGDPAAAQAILDSWGPAGQVYAGLSLGLDYLFMVAYAGSIGLGCVLVAGRLGAKAATPGILLAWGQIAAALLDSLENYALIQLLLGNSGQLWPLLARWCAIPKFGLVVAGLLYVGLGGLAAWIVRANGRGEGQD
ncbi:MAG: hypothetical protein AB1791_10160 [Chloroflexota bacterium]